MNLDIQRNELHDYIEMIRMRDTPMRSSKEVALCTTALYNIINTMNLSRKNKICGEKLTNLDFGIIPLNGIMWSINGEYPCRFDGCKLNKWNFINGNTSSIIAIKALPDGKSFITGSEDGSIIQWNIENGLIEKRWSFFIPVISLWFSSSGRFCKIISDDSTVMVFDLKEEKCIRRSEEDDDIVTSLAFSSDEKCYITGSVIDGTITIHSLSSGECIFSMTDSSIVSATFLPVNGLMSTRLSNDSMVIWNYETGEKVKTIYDDSHLIFSEVFSDDGKYYLSCAFDRTTKLWDLETGRIQHVRLSNEEDISCIAFSPDGKTYLTGYRNRTSKIWDVNTGECIQTLLNLNDTFVSVVYCPDNKTCLSVAQNNSINIWDFYSGKCLRSLICYQNKYTSMAFSTDEKYCVFGSEDHTAKIWDNRTHKCIHSLEAHSDVVTSVACSIDGNYCLTGSKDTTARIWEIKTGKCKQTLFGHKDEVISVAFSLDGCFIITGSLDNTAKVWECKTGKCIHTLTGHQGFVRTLDISADSKYVLTGSIDKTAKIWDLSSGECIHTLKKHKWSIRTAMFSPDGKYCITGSGDNTAIVWDVNTGECVSLLTGHPNAVTSVYFLSETRHCITCSDEGTVKIWDFLNGVCIDTFVLSDEETLWCRYPYIIIQDSSKYIVYKFDSIPFSNTKPILLGSYYCVDNLYIKECKFSEANTDETIREIICQYNGTIIENQNR